jgi:site-specific recombinase XerD
MNRPIELLTAVEMRALLGGCSPRSFRGARLAAVIATMYRAGLRVSELVALRPHDSDVFTGTLTVIRGKGGRRRVVGLDQGLANLLRLWLDLCEVRGLSSPWLFCTAEGEQLSRRVVHRQVQRLAKRVGIKKRVHPHTFRHAFAVEMLREGIDIVTIQRSLGHTSLATTETYLRSLEPRHAVEAVRLREWVGTGEIAA